jgi:hypothetical protein
MRWPVFGNDTAPKPRPKTMAEKLQQAENYVPQ